MSHNYKQKSTKRNEIKIKNLSQTSCKIAPNINEIPIARRERERGRRDLELFEKKKKIMKKANTRKNKHFFLKILSELALCLGAVCYPIKLEASRRYKREV